MEEYKGGINAFVHLSLPDEILVDIEENKMKCTETGEFGLKNDIHSAEHGVHIKAFSANNSHDFHQFAEASDPAEFEQALERYKA